MQEIIPGLWDVDEIGTMVHAYVWVWAEGVTVIDTGMPGNADKILAAVRRLGYGPKQIKRIIATHADTDHIGSLKALKRATGAPIACHTVEKDLLEHPERRRPSKSVAGFLITPIYQLFSLLPAFHTEPVTPDELYVDGDKLPEGFTLIHTPGHTPGHISLLHAQKRVLIAGDALNNRGGTLDGPPPLFTPDLENAHRSIWKLWKKYGAEYDVMVFGHGDAIQSALAERLKTLVDRLFEAESARP